MVGIFPVCSAVLVVFTFVNIYKCFDWCDTHRQTRDLFKKITDTKGTFHAKMGSIKDRNGMDLTEAEDTTQKNYTKKIFMT